MRPRQVVGGCSRRRRAPTHATTAASRARAQHSTKRLACDCSNTAHAAAAWRARSCCHGPTTAASGGRLALPRANNPCRSLHALTADDNGQMRLPFGHGACGRAARQRTAGPQQPRSCGLENGGCACGTARHPPAAAAWMLGVTHALDAMPCWPWQPPSDAHGAAAGWCPPEAVGCWLLAADDVSLAAACLPHARPSALPPQRAACGPQHVPAQPTPTAPVWTEIWSKLCATGAVVAAGERTENANGLQKGGGSHTGARLDSRATQTQEPKPPPSFARAKTPPCPLHCLSWLPSETCGGA
jgi:hypothetical protein